METKCALLELFHGAYKSLFDVSFIHGVACPFHYIQLGVVQSVVKPVSIDRRTDHIVAAVDQYCRNIFDLLS